MVSLNSNLHWGANKYDAASTCQFNRLSVNSWPHSSLEILKSNVLQVFSDSLLRHGRASRHKQLLKHQEGYAWLYLSSVHDGWQAVLSAPLGIFRSFTWWQITSSQYAKLFAKFSIFTLVSALSAYYLRSGWSDLLPKPSIKSLCSFLKDCFISPQIQGWAADILSANWCPCVKS